MIFWKIRSQFNHQQPYLRYVWLTITVKNSYMWLQKLKTVKIGVVLEMMWKLKKELNIVVSDCNRRRSGSSSPKKSDI